ncbi:hypothetical protein BOTBODRAFT_102416, partial [Botryobasidium botryosum FD-172 SS1]
MAWASYTWASGQGLRKLKTILLIKVPKWPDGPYEWQLICVAQVLDGKDVLAITATGDGKSALFYLPILVLQYMRDHPEEEYPPLARGRAAPASPTSIVICPLIGLEDNLGMQAYGVCAVAINSISLSKARVQGQDLYKRAKGGEWDVVLISPEQLETKGFRLLLDDRTFCENLCSFNVDEAHLTVTWGCVFSICRSNERLDVKLIQIPLTHSIGPTQLSFPDILWVLKSGCTTVIYCVTIDLGFRVAIYLWHQMPLGPNRLRRLRLYNALLWDDYNTETLSLLREEGTNLEIIVVTIAFGMGMDEDIQDVVCLG